MKFLSLSLVATLLAGVQLQAADWTIDSADDWTKNIKSAEGATVADGSVSPTAKTATIVTKVHASDGKRSAKSLTVTQSAIWQNWNPIDNLGPVNLADAPVLLTVGPDNYWMFGRYGSGQPRRKKGQKAKASAAVQTGSGNAGRIRHPAADHAVSESIQRARRSETRQRRIPCLAEPRHEELGPSRTGHRRFFEVGHQRGMGRWQGT